MLVAIGFTHVIIGHSERRQYFGETDDTVNLKLKATLEAGLIPSSASERFRRTRVRPHRRCFAPPVSPGVPPISAKKAAPW